MSDELKLDKFELKEVKAGRAKILECTNCGKKVYYGGMNLLALGIMNHKPVCSYECNKIVNKI